jgi:anthranilate phosphoribosyltransferase
LSGALKLLGTERAAVVSGSDGIGEVSAVGPTQVTEINGGATRELTWLPGDFGSPPVTKSDAEVDSPASGAAVLRNVLAGRPGAAREFAVANAAAALWVAGRVSTVAAGAAQAREAIDAGAARELLDKLIQKTNAT